MNKIKTILLASFLLFSGCSQEMAGPSFLDGKRSVTATVSDNSIAYLADEDGKKITSEEYPDGIQVFLGKETRIVVNPKTLEEDKKSSGPWRYLLTMLLVFISFLTAMYFWEKIKRR